MQKIKGDPKLINHDLQKAILIAYLKALIEIIEIAENITKGNIQSNNIKLKGLSANIPIY